MMKKFLIVIIGLICTFQVHAQSDAVDDEFADMVASKRDAVVLIKAFGQAGHLMATGTGFFIQSEGIVITSFPIIKTASAVLVATQDGHLYDLLEVIKVYEKTGLVEFRVKNPDNVVFPVLKLSNSILYEGDEAFVLGINDKNIAVVSEGIVSIARMFEGVGPGLLLMIPLAELHDGAPLLNMKGELIGIISFDLVEKFDKNIAVSILALEHASVEKEKVKEAKARQNELTKKSDKKDSKEKIQDILGQGYDSLVIMEKRLYTLGDTILDGWNEFSRMDALTDFIPQFVTALKTPGSFNYPFDSFSFMYVLKSPDKKFRVFSWTLRFDDGSYRYYGAIHMDKEGAAQLIPLYDYSKQILFNEVEDSLHGPESWFGALYYDIMKLKHKGQVYYILLGWDGNNSFSSKKIIEVFRFNEDGQLVLGAPIFEVDGEIKYRRVFEFNNQYSMMLKLIPKSKMIVFDYLVPPQERDLGKQWLYIPADTYNYYAFKKGILNFNEDFFSHVNAEKAKKLIDNSNHKGDRLNINGASTK